MSTQTITVNQTIDMQGNEYATDGIIVNPSRVLQLKNTKMNKGVSGSGHIALGEGSEFVGRKISGLFEALALGSIINATAATNNFKVKMEEVTCLLNHPDSYVIHYGLNSGGNVPIGDIILDRVTINGPGTGKLVHDNGSTNGTVKILLKDCYMNPSLITNSPLGNHLEVYGTFEYYDGSTFKRYLCEGQSFKEIGNNPNAAQLTGYVMQGNADMNNNILLNPLDPTAGNHVGDRNYNDTRYLKAGANESTQSISGNALRFYVADGYFTYTYDNVNKTLEMVFTAN